MEVKSFKKTFDNDDSRTEKEQLDIAIDEAIEFNKELCWTIADIIDDSPCPNPAVVEVPAANEPAANVISAARVLAGLMENDNQNDDGQSRRKRNIGNIQRNSKVQKKMTKKAKTPSHEIDDEDEDNHGSDDGEESQSKYDSSGIDEEEDDHGEDDVEESQSKYDSSGIDEEEDDHGGDGVEESQSKYDSSGIDEEEDDHGGDGVEESQSESVSSEIDEEEDDSHKDGETEDDSDIDDERSS